MPSEPRASSLAGWASAFLSTLAFSIAAPIGTALIRLGYDPTTILVLRFWLAVALLFGTLGLTAPDRLRLPRRGLLAVAVAGPAIGVGVLLYFWALTRLHTSIAAMLIALEPLTTLLLLALRGERFTYRNLVRVALGLAGVYLLVGLQGSADVLGVLMILGTVLLSSLHTVTLQWFLTEHDGRAVMSYIVLSMALTTSAFWLIQRPDLAFARSWQPLNWQAGLGILALALISTYVARLTLFAAVKRLGGGQVALLAPVETLLTVILSVSFLGDRLTLAQGAGGALILLSAVLAVRRLRRAKVPQPDEKAGVVVGP
jgi:drug/metabolite transporter (DMT)-like permease